MTKDRRRFPRYDVAKLAEFKGELQQGRKKTRLIMFGLGGCGFFSDPIEEMLKADQNVVCTFKCDGILKEPLKLQAKVAYVQAVQIFQAKEIFYGIEFLPNQESAIGPLVKYLEELQSQGKIKVCA
ncbi:MAG: hypothetical protein JWQ35_615 [Bacteriovoracaceae bacterium]|nr:hypothetical protein [Bacteriovoracaceae bacterium]